MLKDLYNTENIKLLRDLVLIRRDNPEKFTTSGLIIPDNALEKPVSGTVIAIGPGAGKIPMTVKPGDHVLFGKHQGTELNDQYVLLMEKEIFSIV